MAYSFPATPAGGSVRAVEATMAATPRLAAPGNPARSISGPVKTVQVLQPSSIAQPASVMQPAKVVQAASMAQPARVLQATSAMQPTSVVQPSSLVQKLPSASSFAASTNAPLMAGRVVQPMPAAPPAYPVAGSMPAVAPRAAYPTPGIQATKAATITKTISQPPITLAEAEDSREAFVNFIKRATKTRDSPEFHELYQFLLKCFTEADGDFDGKVGPADFDLLVDVAARLPRIFGFAPTVAEIFRTADDKIEARNALFASIDSDNSGYINFDHFLNYIYSHICEKAAGLQVDQAQSKMDHSAEDFKAWIIAACTCRHSMEYKELYNFLLHCFTEADTDGDGRIGAETFDVLIDVAAKAPRRFGFAPPATETYRNKAQQKAARKTMFDQMHDETGYIHFEAWLSFCYTHICEKAMTLDDSLSGVPPPPASGSWSSYGVEKAANFSVPGPARAESHAHKMTAIESAEDSREGFVNFIKNATKSQDTKEYRDLYKFLLNCFTQFDNDFDGKITAADFDNMVDAAASMPRRFGFAPSVAELFTTPEEKLNARMQLFQSIDSENTGFINFDHWLNYIYHHICEKAANIGQAQSKMESSKEDFRCWVIAACHSQHSMEYKELYSLLLHCFTQADTDCDGRIDAKSFDALIEVAANAPRRFGFAPPASSTYRTKAEQFAARKSMFDKMNDGTGYIHFEAWLKFCYEHICQKATTLEELQEPISLTMAEDSRVNFVTFIKRATKSRDTVEFHELYQFILKCFTEADSDFDGRVGPAEFDAMIDIAAALPRRLGFAPTIAEQFQSPEEKIQSRMQLFASIDSDRSGFINFDHWLNFIYPHICEKAATLSLDQAKSKMERSKADFATFIVAACQNRHSMEYKELYSFLLHCFTEADTDGDGRIDAQTFNLLVDAAAKAPRRFGFAPPNFVMFRTAEEKAAARKVMFDQMHDSMGYIHFETWLNFCYAHICEKAQTLDSSLLKAPTQSSQQAAFAVPGPAKENIHAAKLQGIAAAEDNREGFVKLIKRATWSQDTDEYRQLYQFLLKCFTQADTDFDGKITAADFDVMVDAAASMPRRFGFAPSVAELFHTQEEKMQARMQLFQSIDRKNTGFVNFDHWLNYIYQHICEKATLLGEAKSERERSKEDFRKWVLKACQSQHSAEYKELYSFLLHCFTQADTDCDGRIDAKSFDALIEVAADAPRRFGFAPPAATTYKTKAQQFAARKAMFDQMHDSAGYIHFEAWLSFCYAHICEKAKTLDEQQEPVTLAMAEDCRESFVTFLKRATQSRDTVEFHELYQFLLKCFTDADVTFDGTVSFEQFDTMVELAANMPRRFGFAPTVAELYQTPQEKEQARMELFARIDTGNQGYINFDHWLNFIFPHICEKVATLDVTQAKSKMERSKADFAAWVVAACRSRHSPEYKELYSFLLHCFTEADKDADGRIDAATFDVLIDVAAQAPRRFGFAPSAFTTYPSLELKAAGRKAQFDQMHDGCGYIHFETWLNFCYIHICQKAKTLDPTLSGVPPPPASGMEEGRNPYGTSQQVPFSVPGPAKADIHLDKLKGIQSAEDSKEGFVKFIKAATRSQSTSAYKELYQFLLKCFTQADSDFDGKVGRAEFDTMVEAAAAMPRRFGFAPTVAESYSSPQEKAQAREDLFARIDFENTGFIDFDHWLNCIYVHICEKAAGLDVIQAKSKMERSKEDFRRWVLAACHSRHSMEYKELYSFLLHCFTMADTDCDGRIDADSFDALIEVAAEAPRRFGFAPSVAATYRNKAEQLAARKAMFDQMHDSSGYIHFEAWLSFCYAHICEKAQTLDQLQEPITLAMAESDRESFVTFLKRATQSRDTIEFHELYQFLLKCFTDADVNFDGKVTAADFDNMVEVAANMPRRFGFAPTVAELYRTPQEKSQARMQLFAQIDTDNQGYINFDHWLSFIYPHICEKVATLDGTQAKSKMERSKADFAAWIVAACRSRHSPEFKELYSFLLHCFTEADQDGDGRIDAATFDALIDVAAKAPRRFGFAPPAFATYTSPEQKASSRQSMFDQMHDATGYVHFEAWLSFCYTHICSKAKTLDPTLSGVPPSLSGGMEQGRNPYGISQAVQFSVPGPATADVHLDKLKGLESAEDSREGFVTFIKAASQTRNSAEYWELYQFLLKCFTQVDADFDGLISLGDFDAMVDAAASMPRRFGFAPTVSELFQSPEEKMQSRVALFTQIDNGNTGFINFDQWLNFIYPHICEKAATLDPKQAKSRMERSKADFVAWTVAACKSRHSMEYKELYSFLLHCFTKADTDLDGRVDAQTFDVLVDVAANAPRLFGFAPPASTLYRTAAQKAAARTAIFDQMHDAGYIHFESWLNFCYTHICQKAQTLDATLTGVPPQIW